jgi:hypothetical protein
VSIAACRSVRRDPGQPPLPQQTSIVREQRLEGAGALETEQDREGQTSVTAIPIDLGIHPIATSF